MSSLAAGSVNAEQRRAVESGLAVIQAQRLPVGPEYPEKITGLIFCEMNHAQFGDHHRPTENRADKKREQNGLACDSRILERENQPAGRQACSLKKSKMPCPISWASNKLIHFKRNLSLVKNRILILLLLVGSPLVEAWENCYDLLAKCSRPLPPFFPRITTRAAAP